jgi:hypothetical protein
MVDRHKVSRDRWKDVPHEERVAHVQAAAEGRRRVGTDTLVAKIVARAGKLTDEQIAQLRAILPEPDEAADERYASALGALADADMLPEQDDAEAS